jgi:uncharacterized membrane protein
MMSTLRKWGLAGLLVVVPIALTFWVVEWIVLSLDKTLDLLPVAWHPERLLGVYIPGLGVVLAIITLLVIGAAASNFFGRKLMQWWDALLNRIPVVRSIYSTAKQVSDTLFSDSGNAFRKAVLVQWPRPGMWTIAFLTGAPQGRVLQHLRDQSPAPDEGASPREFISVYVPTTPNPTGGYFVLVPKSDCVELAMTVDDALKYIISMGVVVPGDNPGANPALPLASAAAAK